MNLVHVNSSNIHSIGYENKTLYVKFLNGSLYEYYGVPENIYIGLMNASSHGKYFSQYVKGNYSYTKL